MTESEVEAEVRLWVFDLDKLELPLLYRTKTSYEFLRGKRKRGRSIEKHAPVSWNNLPISFFDKALSMINEEIKRRLQY